MEATTTVTITPRMMAEAFWNMPDTQQAEFFEHLANVVQFDHASGNGSAYSMGELQWFHLGDRMKISLEDRKFGDDYLTQAGHMLQAMAAPLYLHTMRAAEQARGW